MFVTARRVALAGLLVALGVSGVQGAPIPAGALNAQKELAALAATVPGEWRGGPCEGTITLRPGGAFEWTGIGPGGARRAGKWSLRGTAPRPVLVLKCTEADDPDEEGTVTELKLVRAGETNMALEYTDRAAKPFERTPKATRNDK